MTPPHAKPNPLLFAMVWLLGSLPAPLARLLAGALARLYGALRLREWRVTRRNLALCFPGLDDRQQRDLTHASLRSAGLTLLESLRLWSRPAQRNLRLIRAVEGEHLLDAALAADRGVLVAAPHLGNWELLNQYLASRAPLAIVYRAPRQKLLEALLLRGRGVDGVEQVRAEPAAVRTLLKRLQGGGMVGILPDQQPKRGEGEFAPFFGIPALTMTLLPRLAQRTGASVLFAFAEREADGRFRIRICAAEPAIADRDPGIATAALNRGVQTCVELAPAQYQWGYKRFSLRPEGESALY
ncbi:MAG: lipid A biosynthesis lauroyl acyltransferase [Rhodanobacteraceae bacterium]|nr:lipid A biosynthesis lauroyl acyltransferase [Xanthomonadales bacterium]MCP5478539.1 lipid A biosynthesis lauroyl acyltransferase [Rhodanobacteraceae bacterium]